MTRAVQSAFLLILCASVIWALLYLAFRVLPGLEIKFYPRYTLPLAALLPILATRPVAALFMRGRSAMPPMAERLVFAVVAVLGGGVVAWLTEAAILHAAFLQQQPISLIEILSAPPGTRYTVTTLFGLSFLGSAMLVLAWVTLLRVPLRMARLLPAPPVPEQDAPVQDAPEQDAPEQDAPEQDAPEQDAPVQQGRMDP